MKKNKKKRARVDVAILRRIDSKYHIENGEIVNTNTGEVLPDDEPLMLFRAKDELAYLLLFNYRDLCVSVACSKKQVEGVQDRMELFDKFRKEHPERMKRPD